MPALSSLTSAATPVPMPGVSWRGAAGPESQSSEASITWMRRWRAASSPRQGLATLVRTALDVLAADLGLTAARWRMAGPQPRCFVWTPGAPLREWAADAAPQRTMAEGPDGEGRLRLSLESYGRNLGELALQTQAVELAPAEVQALRTFLTELLPWLERADLLEQLQRESVQRERERIGRDLHDSAVQPYVGLKYGLEALAQQAARRDPELADQVEALLAQARLELGHLRDVVAALRLGNVGASSLATFERQARRFESLYGIAVHIAAPEAHRLVGPLGQAVLHMVNEGLTNVRRHSGALRAEVHLTLKAQTAHIHIRNDHGGGTAPRPFVPRSLQERATEWGGHVEVSIAPLGTEVHVSLPLLGTLAE